MPITASTDLRLVALAERIEGQLVLPGDAAWDEARRAWNLAVDQSPDAVVYPAGVADVIALVRFANDRGLRIAVQGTGHGAAARASLRGAILLNMSRLDGFEIDAEARTVRVEAGALWGPIADAASELGLAPLAGSARDVGVVGYALGGGLGWLGRRYGLAANSVKAIELVTAVGVHRRVDADNEPELFWALRGGGGNFGVVTAMELELFPLAEVYAGWLLWPVEEVQRVFELYREWVETVPDEVTSVVRILHLPPLDLIPQPLRGKSWAVVEVAYLGGEAEAAEILEPLRAAGPVMDTMALMPPSGLGHLHADPPMPVPAAGHGGLLADVSSEAIGELVEVAGSRACTQLLSVELRHLGGALGRPKRSHGALAALDGAFAVFAVGFVHGPEQAEALEQDIQAVLDVFERFATRSYLNFKEREGSAREAFTDDVYARLSEIKAAYDRDGLFQANHPVEAAS
jgi:hypothetical protein